MRITGMAMGALALAGFAAPAAAQTVEREVTPAPMRAPRGAFELGVDLGYTQGFGTLYGSRSVRNVAEAGVGVGVGLGYRATPHVAVAATGQFQGFNASNDMPMGAQARGATAGLEATIHLMPYERADPWISVGAGYRMLWEIPEGAAGASLTHGLELGKVGVGVDLRPSENVAISPMIGVDMNMFMWRNEPGTAMTSVTDRGVNAFVFAGVRGRFDVGGARETKIVEKTLITSPAPAP
jgi:hypothetical protein